MMKEKARLEPDSEVYIDCFNTVISLEIAFSDSTLLLCMDGTIRDLAGLRGTYRLIDKDVLSYRIPVIIRTSISHPHP